jgi:hypothetical protein
MPAGNNNVPTELINRLVVLLGVREHRRIERDGTFLLWIPSGRAASGELRVRGEARAAVDRETAEDFAGLFVAPADGGDV